MSKVLLVDDEPDIELLARQKFRKQISSGAFELLFARNGQQALDLIKREQDIAVVVSDVNMPEMDGLTLLDKLKEINPAAKTIVVSAYGDTKTWRAAMNKGVFDFVTKPVDFNDLGNAISRSLSQYKPSSSQLFPYQQLLASAFPINVNLSYPQAENAVLWDAFPLNSSQIILIGVTIIPSLIPDEIAVSVAHGVLKEALIENEKEELSSFEDCLSKVNPFFKAQILLGKYNIKSHNFDYNTNGSFKVYHKTSKGQTLLTPLQTAFLDLRDAMILESPSSTSHLSLTQAHKT